MASTEYELLRKHHNHEEVRENQCSSYLVKRIKAPLDLVRSLVRRFDEGDLKIGGVREVNLRSGFRTTTSSERLEILEDEERVFSIRIVGGDNKMKNYTSIVTVHPEMIDGGPGTLVVESYVVDAEDGKSKEETCEFVESLIKCKLKSLADVSESLAVKDLNGGSDPGSTHESNSKSKAVEVAEDKLKSIEQDSVPAEVESEGEYSNQEASSLRVEWTATEINLANGRCSELPENLNCAFLVLLFLQHNTYLTEIPASFFKNMPVLRVLDVSHTSIKTLPSSISKLFRLQELFLRGCEMLMELPPKIGRLTNLKVLDLEGTELVCLPKQVGGLCQLERLKFSLYRYADCQLESISGNERSIIPRETLSKLSCLKELSIGVNPECEWWDAEMEAIVNDLGKLGKLETLKLYFTTVELFQQLLQHRCGKGLQWDILGRCIYSTLSNFRLIVGRHGDSIMSCVPRDLQDEFLKLEKCLKYVNGMGEMDAIITKALEHVGALFLDCHWVIDTLSVFDMGKMDKLKFCLIAECNEMKTILGGRYRNGKTVQNSGAAPILGSLCYLGIHYMKNLRSILEGPIVTGSLSSLKILAIHTCPELSTIFNLSLLDNLIFLQELIVEDCPKIQSLVTQESSLFQHKEFLPRLKKISLLHLPELQNISSGLWIAPRLEKMVVYDCPKLKNLHPLERCSKDIQEIKGESEWWESNKSDWGSDQHDYLVRVFVRLEDDDSNDELAEAVRVSLIMSQCATKGNNSTICASGTGSDEPSGLSTGCGSNEIMLVGVREKEPMRKSVSINYPGHEDQLNIDESVNAGSGGYASADNAVHHQPGANQKRKQGKVNTFETYTDCKNLEDGYLWRKCGQKGRGERYPKSYYKCISPDCNAKKRVQRTCEDPGILNTTYEGQHNHMPNKAPNQMVAEPDSKAIKTDDIDDQRRNYVGVEGAMNYEYRRY